MKTPQNVLEADKRTIEKCEKIESQLTPELMPFFTYLLNSTAPKTRLNYLSDIKHFFITVFDTAKPPIESIINIDHNTISNYIARLNSSQATKSRKQSSIKALYRTLYKKDMMNTDITGKLDAVKVKRKGSDEIIALTKDEVKSLNGHLVSKEVSVRDRLIIKMLLTYGLRVSELINLNVDSFCLETNEFTVYRKRQKVSTFTIKENILKLYNEYISTERKQVSEKYNPGETALFLTYRGKRIDSRSMEHIVKQVTKYVVEGGYSPHKLRATAATQMIEQGFSVYDVMEIMDHDNVTTTQLYARHSRENKKQIIDKFEI